MDLKDLKQLWRENDFRPNKKMGQNFLIDKNVRDKIISCLPFSHGDTVVEIGAGFGMMTFALADMCARLYAVEKDAKICGMVSDMLKERDNIGLVNADILEVDISALSGEKGKLHVFGNIPYYISTQIMEKMIDQRGVVRSIYIVMQDEFATRLVARPGSKDYGSISCYIQYFTSARKVFKISKNSFYPRPRVDSCLLELKVLEKPSVKVKNEDGMFEIIRKAFAQRRKKALNSLVNRSALGYGKDEWLKVFADSGVDPASRAEALSLDDYARLADLSQAR